MRKTRTAIFVYAVIVFVVGLMSRSSIALEFIPMGIGDLLYATLIYLLVFWVLPSRKSLDILLISIAICFIVETSQLLSWTWLVELRETSLGKLILGNDFRGSDLVYLTLGTAVGYWLDAKVIRNTAKTDEA